MEIKMKSTKKSPKNIVKLTFNGKTINPKKFKKITQRTWILQAKDAAKVPYLGKVELDISNEEHCGLGLKSHQEIHAGTIIANYEGIKEPYVSDRVYTYGVSYDQTTVNAETFGGAASLINHGLPNCAFSYMDGNPVIVALTDIPKGVFLHTDYGSKYSYTFTPHFNTDEIYKATTYLLEKIVDPSIRASLGREQELRLANNLSSSGDEGKKSDSSNQSNIEVKYIECILKFLFKTPLSMIELLKSEKINKEQIQTLFNAYTQIPISTDEINTCNLITSLLLLSNQSQTVLSTYDLMAEKTVERLCFTIKQVSSMMGPKLGIHTPGDLNYYCAQHLMNNCISMNGQVRVVLDTSWYKQTPLALNNLEKLHPKLHEDISRKLGIKVDSSTKSQPKESLLEKITTMLKSIHVNEKTLFRLISDQTKVLIERKTDFLLGAKIKPQRAQQIQEACTANGINVVISKKSTDLMVAKFPKI